MNKHDSQNKAAEMVCALGLDSWRPSHNAFDGDYTPVALSETSQVYVTYEEVDRELVYVAGVRQPSWTHPRAGITPNEAVKNLLDDIRSKGTQMLELVNTIKYQP